MPNVYVIGLDAQPRAMEPVQCKNESEELQHLLELNHDLLPGEQIDPDDPRRWLMVKREMPVQDPRTGNSRWAVDFFFVDQGAIPTFVECKRFLDTRSRREVVGQMIEYAANGHYYWNKEAIREFAEAAAKARGRTLEEALKDLAPTEFDSVDEFLDRVEANLREGQVRLVFFLEEAPQELKSIVDFLNRQMERSEILLVEARQFSDGTTKVVVPTLFGYTEQARQVKQRPPPPISGRRKWSESAFFEDAEAAADHPTVEAIRQLYEYCRASRYEIRWGTGGQRGSFGIVRPDVCPRTFLTVKTDGELWVNLGYVDGSDVANDFREHLKSILSRHLGVTLPPNYYALIKPESWRNNAPVLIDALRQLAGGDEAAISPDA
jgi:hypothetical protein